MSYGGMSESELSRAIKAARRLRESQRETECQTCKGSCQVQSGSGSYLPEHRGLSVFAACPECDGTGRSVR